MPLFSTARHALQAGNDRLMALAANTSTVVWHTAPDGSVAQSNPSWEAFTGQTEAEASGWGWADAIHPEDRPASVEAWRRAIDTQSLVELSYRLRRRDGVYREMHTQGERHPGCVRAVDEGD